MFSKISGINGNYKVNSSKYYCKKNERTLNENARSITNKTLKCILNEVAYEFTIVKKCRKINFYSLKRTISSFKKKIIERLKNI